MPLRVFMYCLLVIATGWIAFPAAGESVENARWVDHQYGTTDGLPVDSANGAVVDMDGFLWLATHDGLARFDGAHFEIYDSLRFPAIPMMSVVTGEGLSNSVAFVVLPSLVL